MCIVICWICKTGTRNWKVWHGYRVCANGCHNDED